MADRSLNISVVTASFNQGCFIDEAIESVVLQQSSNVEHIIFDGGSSDETVNILKRCDIVPSRKHVKWISEPDGGQSDALNRALQQATGDVVGWLNTDDRYRPGCFAQVQRGFLENPEVDVLYGDYTVIDADGKTLKVRKEIEFNPFILMYHHVLYIATTATFFRRRIFDEGNWLNNDLHYAMDFDLFVRLVGAGYRIKHIPFFLADMRVHPESKSCAKTDLMLQEKRMLMHKHSLLSKRNLSPLAERTVFAGAQTIAGVMRYTEKMVRGHYFSR